LYLAAVALVLSACSSTTVVASENRGSSQSLSEDTSDTTNDQADTDLTSEDEAPSPTADDIDEDAASSGNDDEDRADPEADVDDDPPETPRDLEEADGFGLGGAEQLEELRNDCEAGSLIACDVLFQLSDFDSEEETIALACGGRADSTDGFCTNGIVAAEGALFFDEDSEGLDAVIDRCVDDADLTACDFLFFRSGPNSDTEEIGGTCGGRVDVAVPDCRTFLAPAE